MNERNGETPVSPLTKEGGGKQGVWIGIVIVIAVLAVAFFVFTNKNGDGTKFAPAPGESEPVEKNSGAKETADTVVKEKTAHTTYTVKYNGDIFIPATLEIKAGEKVTFVNESDIDMWVASAVHPTHEILPEFDQGFGTAKRTTYSFTFAKTGTWKFHDHLNPSARGSVTVQ